MNAAERLLALPAWHFWRRAGTTMTMWMRERIRGKPIGSEIAIGSAYGPPQGMENHEASEPIRLKGLGGGDLWRW